MDCEGGEFSCRSSGSSHRDLLITPTPSLGESGGGETEVRTVRVALEAIGEGRTGGATQPTITADNLICRQTKPPLTFHAKHDFEREKNIQYFAFIISNIIIFLYKN